MNISLNLVKKYVDIPENITAEQIAYDLTMRTVEVEKVYDTSAKFHDIVVGEIKDVKAHPNADALRICIVDCGEGEDKQIVCGGSNLIVGHKVCVSKPGAEVCWHGEGEPVLIKESKLRGEPSFGMICASEEIFLGEIITQKDEKEIVDLTERGFECKVGENISDALNLSDIILEIDNKSLTNRPDLWGHYGIARELAAIYKIPFNEIETKNIQVTSKYDVKIEDEDQCPRYTATKIENLTTKESPIWMKNILINAGLRPINAIVDITNYVMVAVGQPLHAFDSTHVDGEKIIVRSAKKGEKLLLLDDLDLELEEGDLVICDKSEPMALAGIKGGKKDSILNDTKSIVLETAAFSASGIRKTSRRFDEKTDSSMRYEKGLDTQRVDLGLTLALELFAEFFPDSKIVSYGEEYKFKTERAEIDVTQEFLDKRLGKQLPSDEIIEILSRLGYEISFKNDTYHCIVPTWRSTGDVSLKDDVLGDIARLLGYEYFETNPITIKFDSSVKQIDKELHRKIKEYLSFRCGFYEIFTYPWVDEKYIKAAGLDANMSIKLATPPSPENSNLRSSLIPGLLEAVEKNHRNFDEFSIYEMAEVFQKGEYHPSSSDETLPLQNSMLSGMTVGENAVNLFLKLKGVIESLPEYCHCEKVEFRQEKMPSWADTNAWLNIYSEGQNIGSLAVVSISSLHEAGIKKIFAAAFEIEVDGLKALPSRTNAFKQIPLYPLVDKDLSIIVDESVKWSDIYEAIKYMAKEVKFVEEYRGEQIPNGKKSIMLSVKIGNDDSTMNTKQIDKKMNGIIKVLSNKCGAELRS